MKSIGILSIILMLFLTACSSGSPAAQTNPGASQPGQATAPVTNDPNSPSMDASNGSLWVRLFAEDGMQISSSDFMLNGQAAPETVLSFNDDQILVVGEDGKFSIPLTLDEGPNLIQITASDAEGNTLDMELSILFDSAQ